MFSPFKHFSKTFPTSMTTVTLSNICKILFPTFSLINSYIMIFLHLYMHVYLFQKTLYFTFCFSFFIKTLEGELQTGSGEQRIVRC